MSAINAIIPELRLAPARARVCPAPAASSRRLACACQKALAVSWHAKVPVNSAGRGQAAGRLLTSGLQKAADAGYGAGRPPRWAGAPPQPPHATHAERPMVCRRTLRCCW